ncbi:DUF5117 domain-containing protein [Roseateles sp. DAIF2]|uniref:zinc-dependent metalloprotease n=1 Tax=Roseateles sp. DAIF2 TaxID=2714952 RepID=UPI0018A2F509|nr:zinc-dependent metalloprotease [Roseateles sp. DAIF2]QPF72623.1 DUF5117 domain-containing protein [Roseateles sp. DAIF2]
MSPVDKSGLTLVAAAAVLLLSGCATTTTAPEGSKPAASAAAAPANGASAPASVPGAASAAAAKPPADPSAPKPFADVIKGAKVDDGLFPLWRKDEKTWIEIPKDWLNKPFLFTVNVANAVGERGLYASQMNDSDMVEFRKVGNQIQLIALNTKFRAVADQGSKRAIEQAFSPSLLGSSVVASAEHPERKSILVDAGFLLADIPGYSTRLEMAYRLPFSVDKANSHFEAARADARLSTLTARLHYATPRIPAPPLTPPPVPVPTPPQATPDPRSLFISFVYNFAALPDEPMAVRQADPRLGHFAESFTDLGGDLKANPRVHYINRWRLEKKDPTAALSEPVKPITFWMDKNIPVKYRGAVEAGILEWNKAFEKIGFKNAVLAKQQPDDADWDNMDAGHASVRWFVGADVGFAIGPSHKDPRSGEIIDADIGMSDVFARGSRRMIVEDVGMSSEQRLAQLTASWKNGRPSAEAYCNYAHEAAAEMNFALDLLEARGDIAPDSPEAEAFVQAVIKDTMMHEVGHTLGLKHNFKASTTISREQLKDKAFTESKGISGSVMDYNAYNLALKGEPQAAFNNTALGPYDYWAIEYAYKQIPAEQEKAELARIAARSTEPALAYADDADAGGFGPYDGLDPLANRFDLGDDPLAYYKKRLKLSQELWTRVQDRKPQVGDDPLRQRRALLAGFNQLHRAAELVGKYVGGMHALRDLPGTTGRPSFKPVEPAKQREALQFLATGLFSESSFRFKPELLSTLTLDYNEWERGVPLNLSASVARVQLVALDRLLSPGTATRMLDLPAYVEPAQRRGMISLNEVYATLQGSVWSELKSGAEIDRLRRNLQREHLKRLQALLTKGSAALPPDALSLLRYNATQLQSELRAAAGKGGQSVETRAHLAESLTTLTEALRATMQRAS